MIKETLEQYCSLKKEITYLEEKIDKLQKKSTFVADTVQNGTIGRRKKITVVYGTDRRRENKLKEYKIVLQNFYDDLLELQIEIESFIEKIEDVELRMIFRYRYYDNFGWIKIMHLMEYNEESTARKRHDRFLEKIS